MAYTVFLVTARGNSNTGTSSQAIGSPAGNNSNDADPNGCIGAFRFDAEQYRTSIFVGWRNIAMSLILCWAKGTKAKVIVEARPVSDDAFVMPMLNRRSGV